jgi:hypothetical protein
VDGSVATSVAQILFIVCNTDGFGTKTYDTDKSGCSVSFIVLNVQFDMIVKQKGCLVGSLVDELGSQGTSLDIVSIGIIDVGGESVERELDVVSLATSFFMRLMVL